ncbi:Fic family protein [Paucidesulfovibrio longus]|uniref:Fic family protein n=1 Tax=Paucidesulfovibrio longus TaxID=889 RepID=UPI0003B40067|nr:Fic family protein [Paucidesulfovibrio longus]
MLCDWKAFGELKDLAMEVIDASARLEGCLPSETARVIGDHLRLTNSYYSNRIEGYRAGIVEIEQALEGNFASGESTHYAQELCVAHVNAEKALMAKMQQESNANVAGVNNLCTIHKALYDGLSARHLFTHDINGFTRHPVLPGMLRDCRVEVGQGNAIGPTPEELPDYMENFGRVYDSANFHGDERLIAMAASHHRLAWLHPFRDGNGRVCRLYSCLYMARSGVNRANLWSLSRGLHRAKSEYMTILKAADPDPHALKPQSIPESRRIGDFCRFFIEVCLDQIQFMQNLLRMKEVEDRIEWIVERKIKTAKAKGETPLHPASSRLLRALFMRGSIQRGEGPAILNVSESTYRRVLRQLTQKRLVESGSQRAPLRVAIPIQAMPYYLPGVYKSM